MLDIQIDGTELQQARSVLEAFGRQGRNLVARSLNRAGKGIPTDASKEARKEYNVKAREVKGSFSLFQANSNQLRAGASSRGGPLSLIHFGARPRKPGTRRPKRGVSVQVMGPRTVIPGTFLARLSGGDPAIFWRRGKKRLPIDKRLGPSVPQMLDHENVQPNLEEGARNRFLKTLDHEVDHFLAGKGLR